MQTLFHRGSALTDNANVNVARLGERFIAMTETPMPVQFDPRHAARPPACARTTPPAQLTTAHPHLDRASGGMLNYAAKLGRAQQLPLLRASTADRRQAARDRLAAGARARLHALLRPHRALAGAGRVPARRQPAARSRCRGRPYIENYRWKPERGTRFTLVDRATGEVAGGLQTEACFAFHHVNAFEDGGEVVVDLCAYPDAGIVEDLYLERLRAGKPVRRAELTRFRLDLAAARSRRERLAEATSSCRGSTTRAATSGPTATSGATATAERLARADREGRHAASGTTLSWSRGRLLSRRAGVRGPARTPSDEDDGVLLSVVLDAGAEHSFLLVLDAADLRELARAERAAPHPLQLPRAVRTSLSAMRRHGAAAPVPPGAV